MKRSLSTISTLAILLIATFSPGVSQSARNRVRRKPPAAQTKPPATAKDDSGPIIYLPSKPAEKNEPVAGPESPASRPAALRGWYQDAAGMEQALQEHRKTKSPVLVYFRADWCGYCKKFERDLLPSPAVEQYLRAAIKVHITPDNGEKEKQFAEVFKITGFPSVFVLTSSNAAEWVTSIDPFIENNDKFSMVSPQRFIRDCRKAGL